MLLDEEYRRILRGRTLRERTGRGPRGEAEAPLHERTTQRHVGSSDGGRDSCSRPIEMSKPPGFGTSRITAETRRARRISFFKKFLRVLRGDLRVLSSCGR